MAENKKSFVLYTDQSSLINLLTDEQAGKLLKHLYAYVNDENPILNDNLLIIAFEPIKQQLKRDLVKWSDTKTVRSNNGKLGGLKSGESRRKQSEAKQSKMKQSQANEAVNDNVNDNVINIPTLDEFINYGLSKNPKIKESLKLKYEAWVVNDWKDGNGKQIKNWKLSLLNTIPYLKESEVKKPIQSIINQFGSMR